MKYQNQYQPLSHQQKDRNDEKQSLKHRNPIYPSLKYPQPRPVHTLQSEIASSLFFQQLVYYNWYFSMIFFYLYGVSQIQRLIYFEIQYTVPVRIIVGLAFVFLELVRLTNGFYGNLKESFPEICAFMMLTVLTIACIIILLVGIVPFSPIIIFQILEFIVCIFMMGKLTEAQKALFLWRNPLSYNANK